MILYNLDHSPYATRVRILAYHKSLPLDVEPPPVPLRTDEFRERFPIAKIPVLQLDDGTEIGDSWAIMEYLEACNPEPALVPGDALARAEMNQLARCSDTCFGPGGLFPLFKRLGAPGGLEDADADLAAMRDEMARLERLLAALPAGAERGLSLADIALAPSMGYWLALAPKFGEEDPLGAYPAVRDWWEWVSGESAVARGLEEMRTAAAAFLGG